METMIFYLIFIAVLFIILFFVIMAAINNSKTAADIEEIKNILKAMYQKSEGVTDDVRYKCPSCGSDVGKEDVICGTCGFKLE